MNDVTAVAEAVGVMPAEARPTCRRCGHVNGTHLHYTTSTYCHLGDCTCSGYRPTRWWHRVKDALIADAPDGLPDGFVDVMEKRRRGVWPA